MSPSWAAWTKRLDISKRQSLKQIGLLEFTAVRHFSIEREGAPDCTLCCPRQTLLQRLIIGFLHADRRVQSSSNGPMLFTVFRPLSGPIQRARELGMDIST